MEHISNSINQIFTRSYFRRSSSPQPNSRHQPAIRSYRENNVETGIDIHSLDHDFPLDKKAGTKLDEPVAERGPEAANSEKAAEKVRCVNGSCADGQCRQYY